MERRVSGPFLTTIPTDPHCRRSRHEKGSLAILPRGIDAFSEEIRQIRQLDAGQGYEVIDELVGSQLIPRQWKRSDPVYRYVLKRLTSNTATRRSALIYAPIPRTVAFPRHPRNDICRTQSRITLVTTVPDWMISHSELSVSILLLPMTLSMLSRNTIRNR